MNGLAGRGVSPGTSHSQPTDPPSAANSTNGYNSYQRADMSAKYHTDATSCMTLTLESPCSHRGKHDMIFCHSFY